jgi:hypothetical protein
MFEQTHSKNFDSYFEHIEKMINDNGLVKKCPMCNESWYYSVYSDKLSKLYSEEFTLVDSIQHKCKKCGDQYSLKKVNL